MAGRVVLLAVLLVGAGMVGYRMREADEPEASPTTVTSHTGPHVVRAVQELALLQGASFHIERVVDLKEKQTRLFGLIEAEDAILLVAGGDVTAGVDLSQMALEDIEVDEKSGEVSIVLPPARILATRLDNQRTYVHSRSTDLLAMQKVDLETDARREAESGLKEAALEAGLLATAENSIARTVAALVTSLGYRDVHISFQSELASE